MDTPDYVSYENAIDFNIAGFTETTTGKYVDCPCDPTLFHGMLYEMWHLEDGEILAPTIGQGLRWLRENGYIISIEPYFSKHDDKISYIGRVYSERKREEVYSCCGDCDYDKALDLCMNKALDLLIN